jgi:hypothetical protein
VGGGEAAYEVTITATNEHGIGTAKIELTVRDDYRRWKDTAFSELEGGASNPKAADAADADDDGISNILEFAAGLDPLRTEPGAWSLQPFIVEGAPRFRDRRIKASAREA